MPPSLSSSFSPMQAITPRPLSRAWAVFWPISWGFGRKSTLQFPVSLGNMMDKQSYLFNCYLVALSEDMPPLGVAEDHPVHAAVLNHRRAGGIQFGYHLYKQYKLKRTCIWQKRTWSLQWRPPWELCSSSELPRQTWGQAWTWQSPGRWTEHHTPPLSQKTVLRLGLCSQNKTSKQTQVCNDHITKG